MPAGAHTLGQIGQMGDPVKGGAMVEISAQATVSAALVRLAISADDMHDFCRQVVFDVPMAPPLIGSAIHMISDECEFVLGGSFGIQTPSGAQLSLDVNSDCPVTNSLRSRKPIVISREPVAVHACCEERFFTGSKSSCMVLIPLVRRSTLAGVLSLYFHDDVPDDTAANPLIQLLTLCAELLLENRWQTVSSATKPVANIQTALTRLSSRQRQVLELASREMTSRDISTQLHVSESTVKQELRRVFRTLGVDNRIDAAKLYRSLGAPPPAI